MTPVASIARALALCFGALAAAHAAAQSYPDRTITVVVPFAAGSGTDAVARVVTQKLSDQLKQPVVVDNRPGASAQIAAQFVASAKPDGYTLLMTTNTSHSANPGLYKNLKYDPIKDFTPITRIGELPFVLAVNNNVPAKTLQEFIDYAKNNKDKLSYATPNSTSLVASETIKRMAGVDVLGVPYRSSPQAMTDLIGGQVQMYVVDLGSGMSMLQSGKVRPLAMTTAKPSKMLPNVPPVADTVKGFDLTSWNGILGPAGMPKPIVDKLNAELQSVLQDKDVRQKLEQLGFEIWPSKTPDEFSQYVGEQLVHWTSLIKQANIQQE
ncbi:MAG: tripartite tricarboxylate transporter substrate binding protein [Pseudomonadota bacterium]|nr:tripartite tricarboxylate transporter substrate binding protein [Pseudomonadota bacterium]